MVEHDGSPGTTDWRSSPCSPTAKPLFAFAQGDLDDGDGRNVAVPRDAGYAAFPRWPRGAHRSARWRCQSLVAGEPDATGTGSIGAGTPAQAIRVAADDPAAGRSCSTSVPRRVERAAAGRQRSFAPAAPESRHGSVRPSAAIRRSSMAARCTATRPRRVGTLVPAGRQPYRTPPAARCSPARSPARPCCSKPASARSSSPAARTLRRAGGSRPTRCSTCCARPVSRTRTSIVVVLAPAFRPRRRAARGGRKALRRDCCSRTRPVGHEHAGSARARSASARPRQLHPGLLACSEASGRYGTGRWRLVERWAAACVSTTAMATPGLDARGRKSSARTRRWRSARRGVLRRPHSRAAVGARADHHGLRPQRGTADRREARLLSPTSSRATCTCSSPTTLAARWRRWYHDERGPLRHRARGRGTARAGRWPHEVCAHWRCCWRWPAARMRRMPRNRRASRRRRTRRATRSSAWSRTASFAAPGRDAAVAQVRPGYRKDGARSRSILRLREGVSQPGRFPIETRYWIAEDARPSTASRSTTTCSRSSATGAISARASRVAGEPRGDVPARGRRPRYRRLTRSIRRSATCACAGANWNCRRCRAGVALQGGCGFRRAMRCPKISSRPAIPSPMHRRNRSLVMVDCSGGRWRSAGVVVRRRRSWIGLGRIDRRMRNPAGQILGDRNTYRNSASKVEK